MRRIIIGNIYLILLLFFVGCDKSTKQESKSVVKDTILQGSEPLDEEQLHIKEYNERLLIPKSTEFEGYKFKFGYLKYDEEKYDWDNPGYLEVYKSDKLLFKDSIEGYDELYVNSLGNHSLSGERLIFTLNYGTELSDYSQISRYYMISAEGKVVFLKEFWSQSTDYAKRDFKNIFPEDKTGVPKKLIVVESLEFFGKEEPDKYDTTHIDFSQEGFVVKRLTNNLDDGK